MSLIFSVCGLCDQPTYDDQEHRCTTQAPPVFDESDVLYRFTPTEEERQQEVEKAEEYVVVRNRNPNSHELRFYSRFGQEWLEDEFGADFVIGRLLSDLSALRDYVGSPGGPPYDELVRENDRLVAERDTYRKALEKLQMTDFLR